MADQVTVSAPSSGGVGTFLSIVGTILPAGDAVQIQLSNQNTTLPTGAWYGTQTLNETFTGILLPVAPGGWYAWAYDPITGAQAVSDLIAVGSAATSTVPVPTSIVASLLGGSAGGETADQLSSAGPVSDTDTSLVAQGGKTLFAQPFSAVWFWIQGHLPGYLLPQITISTSGTIQLDNSVHNQRVLFVSASNVTIMPLLSSLGPGFICDVINASAVPVMLSGITTDTGANLIAVGGIARILAASSGDDTLNVYCKL